MPCIFCLLTPDEESEETPARRPSDEVRQPSLRQRPVRRSRRPSPLLSKIQIRIRQKRDSSHRRRRPQRERRRGAAALESRADVQSDLRKARKKEQRRKHRWRRRIIYFLSFIVFLAVAGAGGIFFYARYRYDEIPKIHSKHLVKQAAAPGKPFNVLLVGSDSRAFVSNPTQVKAFGDEANAGGQRSDVTMVARFVPATKSVTVISIPRDLWVDIPPNSSSVQGMNRINAALQLRAGSADPDDRIRPSYTDQPLHLGRVPRFFGHGRRPGRGHDGLSHRRSRMPTPGWT